MSTTYDQSPPLCLCCEERPAMQTDPHVGDVCTECFVLLTVAHARLVATCGINHCSEDVNR